MPPGIKKLYRKLLRLIPENDLGDQFFSFITFLRMHRRLPTSKPLLNDVLYRMKTTNELIDPLRVFVSDKEFVKLYIKAVAGDQFNVPTVKILHTVEEVENYLFPPDCCIKPTHMSGEVILRRQDKPIDFGKIKKWFELTYYPANREANYKTLKPKVIVEPLIFGSDNVSDYKVFCYLGKPKLIQVNMNRHLEHSEKILDTGWNEMPFSLHYPRSDRPIEKPGNLDKMLEVASLLSQQFSLVRVDLYSNGKECLVGEITNCPGGATAFVPDLYGKGNRGKASRNLQETLKSGEALASAIIFGKD